MARFTAARSNDGEGLLPGIESKHMFDSFAHLLSLGHTRQRPPRAGGARAAREVPKTATALLNCA